MYASHMQTHHNVLESCRLFMISYLVCGMVSTIQSRAIFSICVKIALAFLFLFPCKSPPLLSSAGLQVRSQLLPLPSQNGDLSAQGIKKCKKPWERGTEDTCAGVIPTLSSTIHTCTCYSWAPRRQHHCFQHEIAVSSFFLCCSFYRFFKYVPS